MNDRYFSYKLQLNACYCYCDTRFIYSMLSSSSPSLPFKLIYFYKIKSIEEFFWQLSGNTS